MSVWLVYVTKSQHATAQSQTACDDNNNYYCYKRILLIYYSAMESKKTSKALNRTNKTNDSVMQDKNRSQTAKDQTSGWRAVSWAVVWRRSAMVTWWCQMAYRSKRELHRLWKCITDGDTTCWWNMQLERWSGMESTMTVYVCHMAQFMCKVWHVAQMPTDDAGMTESLPTVSVACGICCWHRLNEHQMTEICCCI